MLGKGVFAEYLHPLISVAGLSPILLDVLFVRLFFPPRARGTM